MDAATRSMLFRWDAVHRLERLQIAIAWKMPHWLVKWCAIRLMANATTGQYGETDASKLTVMSALKRWGD